MDELNEHKSELAEKKEELDQAIEEENESGIRDILKKTWPLESCKRWLGRIEICRKVLD